MVLSDLLFKKITGCCVENRMGWKERAEVLNYCSNPGEKLRWFKLG